MASGSFNLTKSSVTSGGAYIIGMIKWSSTANTSGNYSSVTATLYCKKASDAMQLTVATSGYWTYSLTINGDIITGSVSKSILEDWVAIATHTVSKVNHNADGSKAVTISGTVDAPTGTTLAGKVTSGSKSVSLDTIPRASSVTATDANIGSKTTITITRASSSFTHTLTYAFEGLTGTIATKTTSTSVSWTVPTSFYAKIPDDPSGTCTITCDTYNGSTKVGTSECTFTATASESASAPSVSVTAVDTNADVIALTGSNKRIVKGFSDAKVTTTAEAKNSASISSVSVTCGSAKKTGTSVTFDDAESATIKATATDSRGYSETATASGLTLVNYIIPTIKESISRESPTSDTVNISVKGNWFNGNFGAKANALKVQIRYKPKSQASYEDTDEYVDMTVTTSGNTYTATLSLSGLEYTQAYSIRIRVSDAVHVYDGPLAEPVYRNTEISKGVPVFDWGENDFNFNVPVTINGNPIYTASCPVGYVCITSENEPPAGGSWELLDKEFIPIHGSTDDNSYFSLESASACTFSFSRAHHTIYTRFLFMPTVDLSDSGVVIGTVDIEKLGITDFTYAKYGIGYSDGGNGMFMCELESSGGLITADVIGKDTTIPAGSNCWVEFTHVVRHGSMLDSACNRFYWKRTA